MNAPLNMPRMNLAYGQVTEVGDPDGDFRVKIKLHAMQQVDNQDYEVWARVAVPVAGNGYGTAFLPDVDDEVIVGFVGADLARPIVLGSLYHSGARPADEAVDGSEVKRWTVTGHKGTRVAIDESGSSKVTMETANGVKVVVDDSGSKVTATNGSGTVEITPSEIKVQTGGIVKVEGSMVEVSAPMVTVDAALTDFSGVVMCDVLQTNTVIATTYTPGAGNVW
jgi:uncharacterized protein involved in type VI secretion and phage assembly